MISMLISLIYSLFPFLYMCRFLVHHVGHIYKVKLLLYLQPHIDSILSYTNVQNLKYCLHLGEVTKPISIYIYDIYLYYFGCFFVTAIIKNINDIHYVCRTFFICLTIRCPFLFVRTSRDQILKTYFYPRKQLAKNCFFQHLNIYTKSGIAYKVFLSRDVQSVRRRPLVQLQARNFKIHNTYIEDYVVLRHKAIANSQKWNWKVFKTIYKIIRNISKPFHWTVENITETHRCTPFYSEHV